MSDELSPEMLEEAAPDLLTLEDEDGKEVTFEVIDATEVNGTRYLAVIPYQEDPESLQEDAELILMRIGTDDEGEYMDIVDDDEELITVGKVFEERLRAMYMKRKAKTPESDALWEGQRALRAVARRRAEQVKKDGMLLFAAPDGKVMQLAMQGVTA